MSSARATKWNTAVLVLHESVAGQVPAVAHVVRLPLVGEIAAAGRPAHRELAERRRAALRSCRRRRSWPRSRRPAGRSRPACASPTRLVMKMCSISVEPMPSRIGLPVLRVHSSNTGAGSVSPAETAMPQRGQVGALVHRRHHGAVGGRRGEADRRFVGLDDLDHVGGRGVFQQRRGGAEAQRENRQAAEPEGEGQRRRADEHVVGRDVEHLAARSRRR